MERDRLFSRGNILLIVLGIGGLLIFIFLNDIVFPQSAIDLKLSREEITEIAEDFISKQEIDKEGYTKVIILGADDDASVYLSKCLGIQGTNILVRDGRVPVWRWEVRYFKPLQKKEYIIYITPEGKLIGFRAFLPEAEEGANLTIGEAEIVANSFLLEVFPIDEKWELVEKSSTKREKRTDHLFVWENKSQVLGDEGRLRVKIEVAGDKISAFNWFLKIPEKFLRDYQTQKSYGSFLSMISALLIIILVFTGIIVFLKSFRSAIIPIKYPLVVGIIIAVSLILTNLNSIPMIMMDYNTTSSMMSFIFSQVLKVVISALVFGLAVLIAVAIGDLYGRQFLPGRYSAIDSFRKGKIFTRPLAFSSLRGLSVAFIFIGGQILFYFLLTRKFGVWFPAENQYSDVYGTVLPFLAPLTISIIAGVSEEYIFRLFSVVLLKKVFKFLLFSAIVASAIWALGHSTYAVYPVYIRGIELTIFGTLLFYFFWRYDLMTVIIAHYSIDAFYIGYPLLQAHSKYFFISGLIVMLLALLPLISIAFIRRREDVFEIPVPPITLDGLGKWAMAYIKSEAPIGERRKFISEIINKTFGETPKNIDEFCGRVMAILKLLWGVKAEPISKEADEIKIAVRTDEQTMRYINEIISGVMVEGMNVSIQLTDKLEIIIRGK
ncbi:MAG: CPBP family intramembrane glutamic endopeptidase [bacterium]